MDVRLGKFQLNGSFFNVADCIAIVLLTPVLLQYINPTLERPTVGSLQSADPEALWQIFVRGSVVLADMGACCWELLLPPDRWLRPRISRCFGEGPGTSDEVCDVITCAHPHASRQTSRVRQRSSCSADVSFLRRSCAATLAHSRRRSFEEQCDT